MKSDFIWRGFSGNWWRLWFAGPKDEVRDGTKTKERFFLGPIGALQSEVVQEGQAPLSLIGAEAMKFFESADRRLRRGESRLESMNRSAKHRSRFAVRNCILPSCTEYRFLNWSCTSQGPDSWRLAVSPSPELRVRYLALDSSRVWGRNRNRHDVRQLSVVDGKLATYRAYQD